MYFARTDRNRPIYQPRNTRVRIGQDQIVMGDVDGVIDLYSELSKIFAILDQNNVFTGTDNVFEHIQARQIGLDTFFPNCKISGK
jgi:hypothetical protein